MEHQNTAFYRFPEEIWELIIENVNSTKDIQSMIKAIPELSELPKGKQFSWLIGDLMPLLMSKYLNVKDILACRLVSKRWRNSVQASLETHPDRLPYKSATSDQMSEESFNYAPAPYIVTKLHKVLECNNSIETYNQITENPFPSRHVSAAVSISLGELTGCSNLTEALPFFKAFGHQIWYFSVQFMVLNRNAFVSKGLKPLLECLTFLPNLRLLKISGQAKGCKILDNLGQTTFPFQLETLDLFDLSNMRDDILEMFITTFCSSKKLQKLAIYSDCWKDSFANFFPNLTELSIKSDVENEVYYLLYDLDQCPLLQKLTLDVLRINISRLFEILHKRPWQLKSLHILAIEITYCRRRRIVVLPSIQSLKIAAEILEFQFLSSLPELKYLTLEEASVKAFGLVGSKWSSAKEMPIYKFIVENTEDGYAHLWNVLPKLQVLKTKLQSENAPWQYARECKGHVFKSSGRSGEIF